MNKMIILAMLIFAAFTLRGASYSFVSGENFEGRDVGRLNSGSGYPGDTGDQKLRWFCDSTIDASMVKEYVAGDAKPNKCPEEYVGAENTKYLNLKAAGALFRTANVYSGVPEGWELDTDVYFDINFKFEIADSAPVPLPDDKILMYLKKSDDDRTVLKIIAGKFPTEGDYTRIEPFEYEAVGTVDETLWHRLTVRAVKNVMADEFSGVPVFVIYLDNKLVEMRKGYTNGLKAKDLTATGKALLDNRMAFVSMRTKYASVKRGNQLSYDKFNGFGVEGSAVLDNLAVTTEAPDFAIMEHKVTVKFGDYVTGAKWRYSGAAEYTAIEDGVAFSVGTGDRTIEIAPTYAEGATAGRWEYEGATATGVNTFEILENSFAAITINGEKEGFILYNESGTETGRYTSFAAALNACKNNGTIKLAGDYTMTSADYTSTDGTPSLKSIKATLDLNGYKLIATDAEGALSISDKGTLVITDSSGDGQISTKVTPTSGMVNVMTTGEEGVTIEGGLFKGDIYVAEGKLIIKGGIFDGKIKVADTSTTTPSTLEIYAGKFKSGVSASFYLAEYVDESSTSAYAEGYWTVAKPTMSLSSAKAESVELKSGDTIELPEGTSLAEAEESLTANLSDGYGLKPMAGEGILVVVALTEAALPETANVGFDENGDFAVTILDTKPNLYYGLQFADSLTGDWQEPSAYTQGNGEKLTLKAEGGSFFRLVVTDLAL